MWFAVLGVFSAVQAILRTLAVFGKYEVRAVRLFNPTSRAGKIWAAGFFYVFTIFCVVGFAAKV